MKVEVGYGLEGVLVAQGDGPGALAAYGKSLDIAEAAAAIRPTPSGRANRSAWDTAEHLGELIWWARSDSNRGPRDSLDPTVSGGSGLSLHP